MSGIIEEANSKFPYSDQLDDLFQQVSRGYSYTFESETDQAAFSFQMLRYIIKKFDNYCIHQYNFFGGNFDSQKTNILEQYISPIINYLHDTLDRSNSIIYLLEKYKKRTEWFTRKNLFYTYKTADKNYEQILEDDLRLFLFDQGIDYPFSTPASPSGRVDIVGQIETNDPLIVEIKIFDEEKGYGKDRIKKGFTQVVNYVNDYNKDSGYLVIFNMSDIEINFTMSENDNFFPVSTVHNNKTFYFIVINCAVGESASKKGILKTVEISMNELRQTDITA